MERVSAWKRQVRTVSCSLAINESERTGSWKL